MYRNFRSGRFNHRRMQEVCKSNKNMKNNRHCIPDLCAYTGILRSCTRKVHLMDFPFLLPCIFAYCKTFYYIPFHASLLFLINKTIIEFGSTTFQLKSPRLLLVTVVWTKGNNKTSTISFLLKSHICQIWLLFLSVLRRNIP